ncbi:metal transporter [Hallella multisaccharivorax DSM 17128]|uniref:Heavy metal transport/detoxification protein n=1 Tax=Hallella multisaccharivorax DSM 17128 TaxID=688246 RepID=F8N6D5_9BACT|nr:cation transporter [Hallella multisaccharivorax]EGN57240.1 Heavy metal transport/detoxification protein [Hallella multisaccharivorax DSM 17128]GJG31522.1 metal transporter [Hallella multisaccharivorax DSM 17128]
MKKIALMFVAAMALCVSAQAKTVKKTFKADGKCEMCQARIQKAVKTVPGVLSAVWNKGKKECTVVFDDSKASLIKIEKAVAAAGHDTDKCKASAKDYNKLPSCCKYKK